MNPYVLESSVPRRDRWLAILAIVTIVAALLGIYGWSRGWMRERIDYITFLSDNAGISRSSAVVINGLAVGRVRETKLVERDGELQVEVRFWVDARQIGWLRRGSRVIVQGDLINASRLELQPALDTADLLPAGAELPGVIAPDIFTQLLELQPTVKNLLAEVGVMVAALNERTAQFDPILQKVERQIDGLDAHLAAMTDTIHEAHSLLVEMKKDKVSIVTGLEHSLQRLNEELLPEVTTLVRDHGGELEVALQSMNRTLIEVETQLPAILSLSQDTLRNSRDFTEAAANTWPFSRYARQKQVDAPAEDKFQTPGPHLRRPLRLHGWHRHEKSIRTRAVPAAEEGSGETQL